MSRLLKMQTQGCLEAKKGSSYLTIESIVLKERPPKYTTEIGLWGHKDVGR